MQRPNCHNRPDYQPTVVVQDGWRQAMIVDQSNGKLVRTRVPNMVTLPDPMSKGCQQIRPPHGEAYLHGWDCVGCRHLPEDTA